MARYGRAAWVEIATAMRMLYDRSIHGAVVTGLTKELVAECLADIFEQDSPGFDRAQFYRTCGVSTDIPMEEQHGESTLHTNARR